MKNKILSSLLVVALTLLGIFVVPVEGYSHNGGSEYTWELTYCNAPDGGQTYNCCEAGGECTDQVCYCEH